MQVGTVESFLGNNGIKLLVYGAAGVGKTRLTLTAPRPIYLSCERGGRSLAGSNVPSLPEINTLAQLVDAHNWVLNSAESKNYDTVIVDSVSELSENILRVYHGTTKDGRKAHYDAAQVVIDKCFNNFRDLPRKHVLVIAKERYSEDTLTKLKQFTPSMPNGIMMRELPYKFDHMARMVQVFDMATQTPWEGLQCQPDATAVAKDRTGKLAKWEPPHLGQLFAKATGV